MIVFDPDYMPEGETLSRFMHSKAFARFLIGPFGSGKSVVCCMEIMRRAKQQAPGPDGIRRTRWLVVRSTLPELKTTTIKTWRSWMDDRFGRFTAGPPPSHHVHFKLPDATVVDCEIVFLALDGPDAERKLKGIEPTGIWFNEIREIDRAVIKFGIGRVGRYPAGKDGGPTWYGVIGDTNPPDADSWLYHFAEEDVPDGWAFFKQPGGVIRRGDRWVENPIAENLSNLPDGYYHNSQAGQTDDWVAVFLGNEYGYVIEGKPVYPEFKDSVHVAPEPIAPVAGLPLYVGLDFGLTPAAIIGQKTASGQWLIIDEFLAEDLGIVRFAELLASRLDQWFPGFDVQAWADPAGAARSQIREEETCIRIVNKHALPCRAAPTNEFTLRREAVAGALSRLIDGEPGLWISPPCKVLRKGFNGGYHFKRVRAAGSDRYHDLPDKNAYSHPHDALQYMLLGAGEHKVVLRKVARDNRHKHRPGKANSDYDPFSM